MALHKKEESLYLKKIVFTSRGPLIVRTISWAVDFSTRAGLHRIELICTSLVNDDYFVCVLNFLSIYVKNHKF